MVRRLLIGLVLGVIVGGLAAAALVEGLGIPVFRSSAPTRAASRWRTWPQR
jgi:hypothetical protein